MTNTPTDLTTSAASAPRTSARPAITAAPRTSPWPVRHCPAHPAVILDGGPVAFYCQPHGHAVRAADIHHERTLAPAVGGAGRAAA